MPIQAAPYSFLENVCSYYLSFALASVSGLLSTSQSPCIHIVCVAWMPPYPPKAAAARRKTEAIAPPRSVKAVKTATMMIPATTAYSSASSPASEFLPFNTAISAFAIQVLIVCILVFLSVQPDLRKMENSTTAINRLKIGKNSANTAPWLSFTPT